MSPITLRNIRSNVDINGVSKAFSAAASQLNSSLGGLQNSLIGIDTNRDQEATQAFQDRLANMGASDLANFDINAVAQNSRLGTAELSQILNNKLTQTRNKETADFNYQETLRQRNENPLLQAYQASINGLDRRSDVKTITADFLKSHDNISNELRNKITQAGKSTGDSLFNQRNRETQVNRANAAFNRDEVNRKQKDAIANRLGDLFNQDNDQLSADSVDSLNMVIQNRTNNLQALFGVDIKSGIDPATGKLTLDTGNIDLTDYQIKLANNLASDPILSPNDKQSIMQQYYNDPSGYIQSELNKTVDVANLNFSNDTSSVFDKFTNSKDFNNLDGFEKTQAVANFQSTVANKNKLRGKELSEFNTVKQGIAAEDSYNRDVIQTQLSQVEGTITTPLPLNIPDNQSKTISDINTIIDKLSNDNDGTLRGDYYAGDGLKKEMVNIVTDGFEINGQKYGGQDGIAIDGNMVTSALNLLHERSNFISDEGANPDEIKTLIAKMANNSDFYINSQQGLLTDLRNKLATFDKDKPIRLQARINQEEQNIRNNRVSTKKALKDKRNFIKFNTPN